MNKSISFSILIWFLIISFATPLYSLEIEEDIIKIAAPPKNLRLVNVESNYPYYNKTAMALIDDPKKQMYAKIDKKLYGPFPAIAKGTPFFSPYFNSHVISVNTDNKDHFIVNGDNQKKYDGLGKMIFDLNGQNFAYKAQIGKKQMIVFNGKELDRYDGIKDDPIFSPNGKRLAYIAFENKTDAYVVYEDHKLGPFKNVKEIKFSPDSKRVGFIAFKDKAWRLYIDEKESKPYKNMMFLKFSQKNVGACVSQDFNDKLLILEDFNEHPPYKTIGIPMFNQEGTILAYPATDNKKWFMVVNKKEQYKFDKLGPLTFSKTGDSYGYTGIDNNKPVMVINNNKMKVYNSVGLLKLSTDGKHHAYRAANQKKGWFVVWDGREGKTYLDVKQPIFNPTKNEIAYMAFNGKNVVMVKDGIEGKPYKSINLPKFSPKGNHLAYHASLNDKKWILNIDGIETKNSATRFVGKFPIVFSSENSLNSIGMLGFDFINFKCVIK